MFGTAIVSLSGGSPNCLCSNPRRSKSSACFKLIFFTFVSGDRPIPITWKAVPCKWNGWLRFVCWTIPGGKKRYFESHENLLTNGNVYLRPLIPLPQLHSTECRPCANTYNSCHSLAVDCHRYRIAPAVYRVSAISLGRAVTHTIFRRWAKSNDHRRAQPNIDCMCSVRRGLRACKRRTWMEGKFSRPVVRPVHCGRRSFWSFSNCSHKRRLSVFGHTPRPMDSVPTKYKFWICCVIEFEWF